MEIGIDSFSSLNLTDDPSIYTTPHMAISQLLERIEHADQMGLDVFGIGEHHRKEFLDSAPTMILAAAASRTKNIRLTSAVTVLSTADPVRVFQDFATLDLISNGRAEIIVGRGSSVDAFPLFGFNLNDYDSLFSEKLALLLQIRATETVNWSGKFRPALIDQQIYPRPVQNLLPVWLGVGGTAASFIRAGTLGLPLMIAIIGGYTERFRPLVDLYKEAGLKAGFSLDRLKVGIHSPGYVASTSEKATQDYYPGFAQIMTRFGKERGWAPMTKAQFKELTGSKGALLLGSPEQVAEKIEHHSNALGGISRITFQMDNAALPNEKLMESIALIGRSVKPNLR